MTHPDPSPGFFTLVRHTDKGPELIMQGSESAVMPYIRGSRQQQADLRISNQADQVRKDLARLDEVRARLDQRECAVTEAEDLIRQLAGKVDTLATRVDLFEEQKRADAEAEEAAELSAAEYSLPPGSLTIEDEDEPSEPTHHPSGDLHSLSPSAPERRAQLAAAEDEENAGPVPLSYGKLPTSYVKGESDEGEGDLPRSLTEKVPVPTGTETDFPSAPREPTSRELVGY